MILDRLWPSVKRRILRLLVELKVDVDADDLWVLRCICGRSEQTMIPTSTALLVYIREAEETDA